MQVNNLNKRMMTRLILCALIIVFPFFLTECVVDTFDTRLRIVNKTHETVFINLSKNNLFTVPVVLDPIKRDTLWDEMRWTPSIDSSVHIPPSLGSWVNYINEKCKDSTLTVFIFDKKLLKSVPLDSLVTKQLYSKKFSYKVKDLEKLNWRVEYK